MNITGADAHRGNRHGYTSSDYARDVAAEIERGLANAGFRSWPWRIGEKMPVCFKVYLRETGGMHSAAWEKTTTEDQDAARAAFEALLKRRDLDGKGVAAVLSYENHHLAFHRFDRPPGDPDYWRDRLDEIPWRRETARRGRGNVAGQGRQPKIDPEGGAATTITVRVAERQKETFLRLGGADWLRGVLDEESEKTS